MEISSAGIATSRRNLAQRIDRFLGKKQAAGAPLTVDGSASVAAALAYLESGRYPEGEDAMMLAEKDWQPRGERGEAIPVEVLADQLAALVRA